ncbi:MAG: RDD family protein [Steroidobacteraceae bacterium]
MNCTNCGTALAAGQALCPKCGASQEAPNPFAVPPGAAAAKPAVDLYAGFWRRTGAMIIDIAILYAVLFSSAFLIGIIGDKSGTLGGILSVLFLCAFFVYWAIFESSSRQATPGKMLMAIKVTNLHGERIGFWHALGRHFCRYLSALPLYIGFMAAGFTRRKQTFHDMIAGTLVVKNHVEPADVVAANPDAKAPAGALIAIAVGVAMLFIMGILAAIAIPAYQDYSIRAQVVEGLNLAAPLKASITEALERGTPAQDLDSETVPELQVAYGKYVASVEVTDGVIGIRYGAAANPRIAGEDLILYPVTNADRSDVVWVCGRGGAPEGHAPFLQSRDAGALARLTSVPEKYLPRGCRQSR